MLGIPCEMTLLCGRAIGYPDPHFSGNSLRIGRDGIDKHAVFLDE